MPDNPPDPCTICTEHKEFKKDILNLEQSRDEIWKEINWMKKFIIGSLLTMVCTLIAISYNIYLTLTKVVAFVPK